MTIRPLTSADRALWQPLWQGYLEYYKATLAAGMDDITFARLTSGDEPMGGFLAFDDGGTAGLGQAVGMVNWVTHRTSWTQKDNCYLQDLFVSPDVRGGGHGRALIKAVYAKAAEMHMARVYWHTHESNSTAQVLYDKIADKSGFIVYRKAIG